MKKGLFFRIIGTAVVLFVTFMINKAISIVDPIVSGKLAVAQLEHSDVAYAKGQFFMSFFNGRPMTAIFPLLILVLIWWKPLKNLIAGNKDETKVAVIAFFTILLIGGLASDSSAYYESKDRPEFVEIQPNESAFLVPMAGDNKKSQGKFMSIDYLNENKQATKRIKIPHVEVQMPGLSWNMYIPAAKAIIVDRTPYQREWCAAAGKGTSEKDEGFEFESRDSVGIKTGITIAAYVREEDAAKFTYWFGVKNVLSKDENDKFASVSYGYSLTDVMDTYVRGMVQRTLSKEFGKRDFTECIKDKTVILEEVEIQVKNSFAKKGVTIDYIGLAEQLSFASTIQNKINQVIEARLDVLRFDSLIKMLPLRAKEADIKIKEAQAKFIETSKWDGKLPWYMPEWLVKLVEKWMK